MADEPNWDSILISVKKAMGIPPEHTHFDPDLIMHINSVFMILNQLGLGPDSGYSITGDTEVWSDYISDSEILNGVKTYMYAKVRYIFDPPTSSVAAEALKKMIDELEWRINIQKERGDLNA